MGRIVNRPLPLSLSRQAAGLLGWLVLTFAAAAVGALASANASAFYSTLSRPAWAPPGWLFAPVWSTLYALMGVSAWLVWRARGFTGARTALVLFIAQLAANALWSWLFFVWHQGSLAFIEAVLLWCLIAATILSFWRISTIASALLMPYLAWVTFASALTFSVWRLNPGVLS
jgi:tryptophan-rich sensory protein